MAERRMFAKSVVESDAFLDMPASAQALYFHLGMEADDEGFVNSPRKVQRSVGAASDDLKLLIAKGFVISFTTGVVVVRHWKVNNYIQNDRRKKTQCVEEAAQLTVGENRVYELSTCMDTRCIQAVSSLDSQIRLEENRLEENRLEEMGDAPAKAAAPKQKKPVRHKHGRYKNVLLTDADLSKLKAEFPRDWQARIDRLSEYMESRGKTYKNHLATIRAWARREAEERRQAAQKPLYDDSTPDMENWTEDEKEAYYAIPF